MPLVLDDKILLADAGTGPVRDAPVQEDAPAQAPQAGQSGQATYANADLPAEQGAQNGQAASANSGAETCKVEARFNSIGSIPFVGSYYHAYVVTTDADSQDYFRGGPSEGGPSSGFSGALSSGSGGSSSQSSGSDSNSSNSTSPGSGPGGAGANNGPFGPIATEHGPYVPGTVDWNPNQTPTAVVATEPGNCDAVNQRLAQQAGAIEAAQIPYNPFSTNSNAAARQMLEGAGFHPGQPPVWAPGWNAQLRQ